MGVNGVGLWGFRGGPGDGEVAPCCLAKKGCDVASPCTTRIVSEVTS